MHIKIRKYIIKRDLLSCLKSSAVSPKYFCLNKYKANKDPALIDPKLLLRTAFLFLAMQFDLDSKRTQRDI